MSSPVATANDRKNQTAAIPILRSQSEGNLQDTTVLSASEKDSSASASASGSCSASQHNQHHHHHHHHHHHRQQQEEIWNAIQDGLSNELELLRQPQLISLFGNTKPDFEPTLASETTSKPTPTSTPANSLRPPNPPLALLNHNHNHNSTTDDEKEPILRGSDEDSNTNVSARPSPSTVAIGNPAGTTTSAHSNSSSSSSSSSSSNSSSSSSSNSNSNSNSDTLPRLPSVDWTTTLATAELTEKQKQSCQRSDTSGTPSGTSAEGLVREIAGGWLRVLRQLDAIDRARKDNSVDKDIDIDRILHRFRSQIFRRLFSMVRGWVRSGRVSAAHAGVQVRVRVRVRVRIALELARTVLGEAGNTMTQPEGSVALQGDHGRVQNESNHETQDDALEPLRCYGRFTALIAECCEYLGEKESAWLAYKSLRILEETRLPQQKARRLGSPEGAEPQSEATLSSLPTNEGVPTPANTPVAKRTKCLGVNVGIGVGQEDQAGDWVETHAAIRNPHGASKTTVSRWFPSGGDSALGTDLVPAGSLEERIARCSGEAVERSKGR